jgi:thioredoxin 1
LVGTVRTQFSGGVEKMKLELYGAEWCNPCQLLKKVLAAVLAANPDVEYEFVDIDESPERAQQMNVRSVPTLAFLKDGKVKDVLVGLQKEKMLQDTIDKWRK